MPRWPNSDPTWSLCHGTGVMDDEFAAWRSERAAQRCDECRYFAPIGGTRGDGRCRHGKPQTYTRGCDRCDAFARGAKHEPVDAETFAAATLPRWILEARPDLYEYQTEAYKCAEMLDILGYNELKDLGE